MTQKGIIIPYTRYEYLDMTLPFWSVMIFGDPQMIPQMVSDVQ